MDQALNAIQVQFDVQLNAGIDTVWNCLINDAPKWWSSDFYTNAKTKAFYIEGRIGGKAYEDFGNGEGLIWSEVIGVDAPNSLQMKALLMPEFGGPATSIIAIRLESDQSGTMLTLSDTLFGAVNESTAAQIEAGWKMIYGKAFKAYVDAQNT